MSSVRQLVLVTTHYPPQVGGAATHFSQLAQALAHLVPQITVLTTSVKGHPAVEVEGRVRVWRRIPDLSAAPDQLRRWVQAAATLLWLAVLWSKREVDLVHVHGSKSVTVGAAVFSSLFRRRVVFDIQDFFSRPRVIRWGTAPQYVATGGAIASRLLDLGVPADQILTIQSIPPDESRRPIVRRGAATGCRYLYVGELRHSVKGSDVLFDAFVRVHESQPVVQLVVVGDGPDRWKDEAFVRRHDLDAAVRFNGVLQSGDTLNEIDRADVLVLPSRSEGMPRVILEAFARGVPVIATDVGGIGEAVRNGENGLLVPSGNATALAKAILSLSDNLAWRHELGDRGRAWIDQLPTWSAFALTLVTFYDGSATQS